jgi:hypothetical protein
MTASAAKANRLLSIPSLLIDTISLEKTANRLHHLDRSEYYNPKMMTMQTHLQKRQEGVQTVYRAFYSMTSRFCPRSAIAIRTPRAESSNIMPSAVEIRYSEPLAAAQDQMQEKIVCGINSEQPRL